MPDLLRRFRKETTPAQLQTFHKVSSTLMLALVASIAGYLFWGLMQPRMDFYNELWGPVSLLVRGQSPYNTSSLNPTLPAAWLPMALGFFFPLGWLSETTALQAWYVFNMLALATVIYFSQGNQQNLFTTTATAILCFFFPLMLNHINLGQFSLTVVLCWVFVSILWRDARLHWLTAFLVALALTKPHLGTLVMLGLLQHDYMQGGLKRCITSMLRILTMCLVLSLPLFIAYPNWIPDMVTSMGSNPPWSYPSLYILFGRFLGAWGIPLWILAVVTVVGVNAWLWSRLPFQYALFWSLALSPLITPYVGSWDFVVLFPLLVASYVRADGKQRIFLWAAYLAAWFMMARIQMLEVSHNHYFWWVPLWFAGMGAIIAMSQTKRTQESVLFRNP